MWKGGVITRGINAFKHFDTTPEFDKELDRQYTLNKGGYNVEKISKDFNSKVANLPNKGGFTSEQVDALKGYHKHLIDTSKTMEDMPFEQYMRNVKGVGVNTRLATQAFQGLKNVLKSVGAAMSSMLVSMAASFIITKVIGWIEEIWVTAEEAKQALNEFTDAWDESHKKIQEDSKALPDLVKKYKDLVDGVDSLGNNMSLTDTEYNEYLDTVSKISEAMPSLTTYFNEQGQAIGLARGELDNYNQAYKRQIQDSIHEKWYGDGEKDTKAAIDGVINAHNNPSLQIKMRDYMIKKLLRIGDCVINGSMTDRLANNISISFKGIDAEALLLLLDTKGICISSGSACNSREKEVSYVLKAIGLDGYYIHGTIRISLSENTTYTEIDTAVEEIKNYINALRLFK